MYESNRDAVQPSREGQVGQAMQRLQSALNDAEKSFAALVSRVSPILRAEPPSTEKDGPKPVESLVALADQVRAYTDRVHALSSFITNVSSRVEL